MKVILICQKSEFDNKRLKELQKHSQVIWIDKDHVKLNSIKELFDSEEKVLAISPVPLGWKFPEDLYSKMNNLKYLCLVTTSHEFLDLKQCKLNSIKVTNIPHYSTEAVSEQGLFMLLAISKRLPVQIKSGYKYKFTDGIMGDDLRGKQVGIIGFGDIGSRVAEAMMGIGTKVVYWSRKTRDSRFTYLPLDQLLSQSDVVFPLISAEEKTFGFLGRNRLKALKKDSYFIGLIDARIWDKGYLLERIKNNTLAGLAFESDKEKMADFEGNVFVVPPFAWYSKQSLDRNIQVWTDTIISCIGYKPINQIV